MRYKPIFDVPDLVRPDSAGGEETQADRRDGRIYVYNEPIKLAVNVALATGRPLLLRGLSGCGKSSLARNVAQTMRWPYYEYVVTARSEARDLLWQFDTLRRLADAHVPGCLKPALAYVEPGQLWWAIDPETARRRGHPEEALPEGVEPARDPGLLEPMPDPESEEERERAVLLVDEIDKAELDFPNNLLVPLGSYQFTIQETGQPVSLKRWKNAPLIFITTNEERDLPAAFLRRCIVLNLEAPGVDRLIQIGKVHFPRAPEALLKKLAERVAAGEGEEPSTAEYLDAVRAVTALLRKDDWENAEKSLGEERFNEILEYALLKSQEYGTP